MCYSAHLFLGCCFRIRTTVHNRHTNNLFPINGLLDFFTENNPLLKQVKETLSDSPFGPGPLIFIYAIPESMEEEELRDMVEAGMDGRKKRLRG